MNGGNADRSGEVSVGDQLIATSGFTYTTQQKYQDNWVKGGEQVCERVHIYVRAGGGQYDHAPSTEAEWGSCAPTGQKSFG